MKIKILGTCTSSISILTFSKTRGSSLKNCGRISRTNDVPYIEYVLSFLKNDEVQQPVIFPTIDENQNPWHMHIFNIHTNIQQNKRLFIQKLW